ncbi:MAG: hypothetical protein ABIV51_01580 [Saprospiraceae bacterium]
MDPIKIPANVDEIQPPILGTWKRLYWFVIGVNLALWALLYLASKYLQA